MQLFFPRKVNRSQDGGAVWLLVQNCEKKLFLGCRVSLRGGALQGRIGLAKRLLIFYFPSTPSSLGTYDVTNQKTKNRTSVSAIPSSPYSTCSSVRNSPGLNFLSLIGPWAMRVMDLTTWPIPSNMRRICLFLPSRMMMSTVVISDRRS